MKDTLYRGYIRNSCWWQLVRPQGIANSKTACGFESRKEKKDVNENTGGAAYRAYGYGGERGQDGLEALGTYAAVLPAHDCDCHTDSGRCLGCSLKDSACITGTYRERITTMKHKQNVGTVERWIRVIGGTFAAVVGLFLLFPVPASLLLGLAGGVLVLLGLDFVVTGITGYCPLYHRLGWSTNPVKS